MGAETWTTAKVETLRELWAEGAPGGVIAKRLGTTRGAVAGKRARLGLEPRDEAATKAAQAANGRRTALALRPRTDPKRVAKAEAQAVVVELIAKPLKGSNPRPWELREPGQCAFPVMGYGAGTLSCCEPVEGGPYCFAHREIIAGRPWPPLDPSPELAATQWAEA